jgi:hypothetical protein
VQDSKTDLPMSLMGQTLPRLPALAPPDVRHASLSDQSLQRRDGRDGPTSRHARTDEGPRFIKYNDAEEVARTTSHAFVRTP